MIPSDLFHPHDALRLATFTDTWTQRLGAFHAHTRPPWWSPGLRVTPALRTAYNAYLPIDQYAADLRWVLAPMLPSPAWMPRLIGADTSASLPDLWRDLPPDLAGRVGWSGEELPRLACALASPFHFGTATGRYPEQLGLLVAHLTELPRHVRLLDYGCGTGQGTYDLVTYLECAGRSVTALGLTREPLEAWMATHRSLPHLSEAQPFAPYPRHSSCTFIAADVLRSPVRGSVDLAICNGLLGGPAMAEQAHLDTLFDTWLYHLVPGGMLLLGDRFHDGHADAVANVRACAGRHFDCLDQREHSAIYRPKA